MKVIKDLKLKDCVFFDIEIATLVKEIQIDTPLFEAWKYKKRKEGVEDNLELMDTFRNEAALYPEFSKVICIVVGRISDGWLHTKKYYQKEEHDLLTSFNDDVSMVMGSNKNTRLVGFASSGFDTPFLLKRMIINGIAPHSCFDTFEDKPWLVNTNIDVATLWKGGSWKRASLLAVATAMGLPSPKDAIAGHEVGYHYWCEDNLEGIVEYCEKDVLTLANIVRKIRREPVVEIVGLPMEVQEAPLLTRLAGGEPFGKKTQEKVLEYIGGLDDKDSAIQILEALAASKKSKVTKAFVNRLKKKYEPAIA